MARIVEFDFRTDEYIVRRVWTALKRSRLQRPSSDEFARLGDTAIALASKSDRLPILAGRLQGAVRTVRERIRRDQPPPDYAYSGLSQDTIREIELTIEGVLYGLLSCLNLLRRYVVQLYRSHPQLGPPDYDALVARACQRVGTIPPDLRDRVAKFRNLFDHETAATFAMDADSLVLLVGPKRGVEQGVFSKADQYMTDQELIGLLRGVACLLPAVGDAIIADIGAASSKAP